MVNLETKTVKSAVTKTVHAIEAKKATKLTSLQHKEKMLALIQEGAAKSSLEAEEKLYKAQRRLELIASLRKLFGVLPNAPF